MGIASDLTGALDPVLLAAGFAAGQGGTGVVDGKPVGITYCAGHDALSDRFPWLPQADEYPRGKGACTDLVIQVNGSGVVERVDFEGFTLGETLAQVGDTEDARTAAGLIGQNVGELIDVLPAILERLFRDRA